MFIPPYKESSILNILIIFRVYVDYHAMLSITVKEKKILGNNMGQSYGGKQYTNFVLSPFKLIREKLNLTFSYPNTKLFSTRQVFRSRCDPDKHYINTSNTSINAGTLAIDHIAVETHVG